LTVTKVASTPCERTVQEIGDPAALGKSRNYRGEPIHETRNRQAACDAFSWSMAYEAGTDAACFTAQSTAKSAAASHPGTPGRKCGPSNSTTSVTVFDL